MNGKGGTGKSTVSALLLRHLVSAKSGSLLAIDADPNSNLPELLGIKDSKTIVGMVEEIAKHMDKIPQGMTKDRFIEMRIQEESFTEEEGFDLVVMGRPEGPGCYCYVNSLLRNIMGKITRGYDFVIIDNAAGMEHISRRTEAAIDRLVLVSDYSIFGIRSAKKIYDLAKELGIKMGASYLIINKLTGPLDPLTDEIKKSGLKLAGSIPFEEELGVLSISSRPIFELRSKAVTRSIEEIFSALNAARSEKSKVI